MMTRVRLTLDGVWDFVPDPQQSFELEQLEESGPLRKIKVPCPWQAAFDDLRDYSGVAWYRRTFDLPSTPKEIQSPTYWLHFGAVDYFAAVWLNRQLLGVHEGGYLPFEMQADSAVRHNEPNELVVRVVDPGNDADYFPEFAFAEIPHGKQSWYGPMGGIWQSVYLEVRSPVHIERLKMTPDVAGQQVLFHLRLSRSVDERTRLRVTLKDPKGNLKEESFRIRPGKNEFESSLAVPEPILWDTKSPHLYTLEATLLTLDDCEPIDSVSDDFGMRVLATSADGHLQLNGRILYLRGALDQDYYPHTEYTPFSDAELDDQFAKAKHMGLNCLRTHLKIADPRYYAAADRAGLLIWTELPNWQNLTELAKRRARDTLHGMVERDWNHPSIIVWTIINEGWGVDLAVNPEHRAWLAETYSYLKTLDPHRLIVGNSPCFSNFHVVTDIEDFHNYYAIPDHYRQWREWVRTFAMRPPWTFAHVYENIQSWREFTSDPWSPVPRTPAPEVRRLGSEPMIVSEFGNWGLPDVSKLRSCYQGQEPWWFETGLEWADGVVYPHGVERRFKTFHLDKVFTDLSTLSAASQRAQFTALKYEIEEMRSHSNIVGYIITEFTDVHWESNGLLDMCRNPKAYYDSFAAINGADAIIPTGLEKIVFWENDAFEVRVLLSHFSDVDLIQSRLEWHLDLFPDVKGTFSELNPQQGRVTQLGTASFRVPRLSKSLRVRLEFELFSQNGERVARNHQELYFIAPLSATPCSSVVFVSDMPWLSRKLRAQGYRLADDLIDCQLAVAATLTDELLRYIQRGGRVLWLADSTKAQQTYLGNLRIAQRAQRPWQGDWASTFSWIRQDRMFQNIPTGHLVDFAFADLTPDYVIVGLSPRDFAADVHAGMFVGWIHQTVALIAEQRIGNGRLLISTFRLRQHRGNHPIAAVMLHDMITHLAQPLTNTGHPLGLLPGLSQPGETVGETSDS